MEQKKEVQEKIIKADNIATEEDFYSILKLVAPGTNLRAALDGTLKAQNGALVVVENEYILPIIDGGFRINTKFTPQKLIELAKMDGAIILSSDIKKINYANVLMTPDSRIRTAETGTRHKAAERTAKEIGTLVIAISERRHEITLFYKNLKHPLIRTEELLRKTNENIQLIEKQRELFDKNIEKLNYQELRNYPSLTQAIQVIQKGLIIGKILNNLKRDLIELGKEGTLLKMRLKEIIKDVEEETGLVIKDYTQFPYDRAKTLLEGLSYDEILENARISELLGYEKSVADNTTIKGWRILNKTCLHDAEIAEIIKGAGSLGKALHSNGNFYAQILGMEKAKAFQEEVRRIKLNVNL